MTTARRENLSTLTALINSHSRQAYKELQHRRAVSSPADPSHLTLCDDLGFDIYVGPDGTLTGRQAPWESIGKISLSDLHPGRAQAVADVIGRLAQGG